MNNKGLAESSWFEFADKDLEVAKYLDETMYPKPLEIICYHCEQAVEKYLKAFILYNEIPISKTHNLPFLLQEIERIAGYELEEKYFEMCDLLVPFGVAVRYPNEIEVNEEIVRRAIRAAEEMKRFIEKL